MAIVVEGDQKAPFSIATTLRCRRRCYSILWKVKLVTLVKGDLKAPFSIATTLRYRRRRYSILWKVKLVTLVEGDPKAPFSIATTLRCRKGTTGLLHFTLVIWPNEKSVRQWSERPVFNP